MPSLSIPEGLKRFNAGLVATAVLAITVKALLKDSKRLVVSIGELERDTGERRPSIINALETLQTLGLLHFDALFTDDTDSFEIKMLTLNASLMQKRLPGMEEGNSLKREDTGYDEFESYQGTLVQTTDSGEKFYTLTIKRSDDTNYFREKSDEDKAALWLWFDETVGQVHDASTATGTGLKVEDGGAAKPKRTRKPKPTDPAVGEVDDAG